MGIPSGTDITISVTAIMKYFSTVSAILSQSPECHTPWVSIRMSRPRNTTKAATLMATPNLLMSLASLSSWMFSGVFTDVISVLLLATCPISVASPTAVTRYKPRPFITMVPRSTLFEG